MTSPRDQIIYTAPTERCLCGHVRDDHQGDHDDDTDLGAWLAVAFTCDECRCDFYTTST